MALEIFQVLFDFEANKEDELSIVPGDEIIVLDRSGGDWWFGRNKSTGQEGWFPKDFGQIKGGIASAKSPTPSAPLPPPTSALPMAIAVEETKKIRHRKVDSTMAFRTKEETLLELLGTEERYVSALNTFRTTFLDEIHVRDTEEKRKLCYGHRSVSIAFELFDILQAHNQQLLQALKKAGSSDIKAVAQAFLNFAAAQEVYALYSANHAEALIGLEKLNSVVNKYLKDKPLAGGLTLSRYLGMPTERFPQYLQFLNLAAQFTSPIPPELTAAIKAMEEGLDHVDETVDEQTRQNELINLQAQFMGYVDLYAPDRRIIKEGPLKKIYIDASGRKPQERHIHLLSDALIYSSKLIGPYKYKLAKIHGLELFDAAAAIAEDKTMFDITKVEEDAIRFQAPDETTALEWIQAINDAAYAHKAKASSEPKKKPQQTREARVNAVSFLKKHGLKLEKLPERSRTIVYGIKADLTYIEYLKVFARVVGVTLDELSRGIGAVGGKRGTVENGDQERAKGLFETKTKAFAQISEGTINRNKAENAKKPLQSSEFAVFLKTLPIVEALSQSLVEKVEERLTQHSATGPEFCIGDVYLGMSALFVAYTKYASVMDEGFQVLSSPALAELAESLSDELSPLTIGQHLNAPLEAAQRMAVQLKAVLEMTAPEHSDRKALEVAALMLEQTAADMEKNLQDTKNYWKLVSIRESIGSMEFKEARLDTLITSERKLLLEGTLLKACRSKDKSFMFWLFNDCLIYATHLPGSSMYQLNRWITLYEMRVEASAAEKTGLDILTGEKSFTMYGKDESERDLWLRTILDAIVEAREKAGIAGDADTFTAAPILVQTSDRNDCSICHQKFTLFVRKHHCLSCGEIVCDKCSPSRMILPNISKTERQRVCNTCISGDGPTPSSPAVGGQHNRTASSPHAAPKAPAAPSTDYLSARVDSPRMPPTKPRPEGFVAVATPPVLPQRNNAPAALIVPFSPGEPSPQVQQHHQQQATWGLPPPPHHAQPSPSSAMVPPKPARSPQDQQHQQQAAAPIVTDPFHGIETKHDWAAPQIIQQKEKGVAKAVSPAPAESPSSSLNPFDEEDPIAFVEHYSKAHPVAVAAPSPATNATTTTTAPPQQVEEASSSCDDSTPDFAAQQQLDFQQAPSASQHQQQQQSTTVPAFDTLHAAVGPAPSTPLEKAPTPHAPPVLEHLEKDPFDL